MLVKYHKTFDKSFLKLLPKLQHKIRDTVVVFMDNPFDQNLRNHALKWKRLGFRSVDVNWDLRIVFRELSSGKYELVELVEVGSHSQLY